VSGHRKFITNVWRLQSSETSLIKLVCVRILTKMGIQL